MVTMSLTFKQPKKTCSDKNCPFHGTLPIRGRVLEGVVATAKMDKTIVVQREYLQFSTKFVRYERRRSHIPSHSPPCIDVKEGDRVIWPGRHESYAVVDVGPDADIWPIAAHVPAPDAAMQ